MLSKKFMIILALIVIAIIFIVAVIFYKSEGVEEYQSEDILEEIKDPRQAVIGSSVDGRSIDSYTFGNGNKHLAFVGGIHGGYEWNGTFLAYKFIDYFIENPQAIPKDITVTIIPSANPDGLFKITGKEGRFDISDIPTAKNTTGLGRFNANNVDLNRNFDCKWKSESNWRSKIVSAGSEPFSEPESKTIRDFVKEKDLSAVVFWHSQANAVYASECEDGVLPKTIDILNSYAKASGYTPFETFDSYEVTGDAGDWLASIGIPSIAVELKTHDTVEWQGNLAGVKALFDYFTNS